MSIQEWLSAITINFVCATVVVIYVAMEWTGKEPSALFVVVLTACLGALGIGLYDRVAEHRLQRRIRSGTKSFHDDD